MNTFKTVKRLAATLLAIGALLALPLVASADTNKFIEGNGPINKADPLAVAQVFTYQHVTTGTVAVKATPGVLHSISVNGKGASGKTVTVYDNTAASGTVIGVIDTNAAVTTLNFDDSFSTGLTVLVAAVGGTDPDVTVNYR